MNTPTISLRDGGGGATERGSPEHALYPAQNQNGFTLIELLVVVVIIGILAAIAIPKFSKTKEKAYMAAMKSDLRNLVAAEETYFADDTTYTNAQAAMSHNSSAGVTLTITLAAGPPVGYSATTVHTGTAETCAIFIQAPVQAPATNEGEPKCT